MKGKGKGKCVFLHFGLREILVKEIKKSREKGKEGVGVGMIGEKGEERGGGK